ncbi:U3 small nucleolar RNA-associated protein [Ceratobasidium sp. 414]|nr:U3 small nucleolar RNA-associated protein [Ceratobasidium sp. 414]
MVGIHRCRFISWSPSPITATSLPPPPVRGLRADGFPPLAVGRQNGSIELYQWSGSGQAWVLHATLPGPAHTKVDALAFTLRAQRHTHALADLRLFSISGGADLFEWDLSDGTVQHTIPSQGGTIWSLAPNPAGSLLAIGCQDGAIRLLDISDPARPPVHSRRFDRLQTRFLSIAWGSPTPVSSAPRGPDSDESDEDEDLVDTTLVTGCSDSCLRTWDVRTGRVVNRMAVERARGERTLVWSVAVLGDGTIVSGDSLGAVKFWDAATATQIHSFPAHDADVLCMTVSPSGAALYTAGVDQRITEFVCVPDPSAPSGKWVQTTSRRIHSHDVRALAMWPPYSPSSPNQNEAHAPLLISAGLDMSLAVTPASASGSTSINPLLASATTFQDAFQRRIGHPVSAGGVVLAPRAKLAVSCSGQVVGVWRLPEQTSSGTTDELGTSVGGANWEKLLEMELRFRTNLTASAVSADGQWLAVADAWETKLFKLEEVKATLRPRRSRTIAPVLSAALSCSEAETGASALAFTPDSRRLVVATWRGARVVLVDLDQREEVVRVFDVHREAENKEKPRIERLAVSSDCQWLATADSQGRACVFNLDSVKHVASLPRTDLPPSALAFDTRAPHVLALGYPNNTLQLFDAEAQRFYPALPERLAHLHDPILGIAFPPSAGSGSKRKMYVWSATWLARFDVPNPSAGALLKQPAVSSQGEAQEKKKRKRTTAVEDGEEPFGIVTKFRPVLLVDFCEEGEMVVVERPLVDLLATLPPAYHKPKYGAS